jgi:hypothetical protein
VVDQVLLNGLLGGGLFGGRGAQSSQDLTNLLVSSANARSGLNAASGGQSNPSQEAINLQRKAPTGTTRSPTAPWISGDTKALQERVKSVLNGGNFIKENNTKLDLAGASADYKKLYTLYQGIDALKALAQKSQEKDLSSTELAKIKTRFDAGMKEVQTYLQTADYEHLNLIEGSLSESLKTSVKVAGSKPNYMGTIIHTGTAQEAVPEFSGDIKFEIKVQRLGTAEPRTIAIDLSDMGTQTRSLSNVADFINNKFKDEGLSTRLQVNRTQGKPETIKVGTQTITTSEARDSFALNIKGDTTEILTFSAEAKADSVYVVQTAGKETKKTSFENGKSVTTTTNDYVNQLLKFQTDQSSTPDAPQAAVSSFGATYWTEGLAQQSSLEATITKVRATQSSSDGGVYMLADVKGKVGGQEIKGASDVALLKYDSTGRVVFTRTLGAADKASGYALAVSLDGQVAVAGTITGRFEGKTGADVAKSDSFVTLYDAKGEELWTKRTNAKDNDEAISVAFGADNSVYVGGRTQSVMPGVQATHIGDWDAYILGFDKAGKSLFASQSGTINSDATQHMAVSGNDLYVASSENGNAILTRYDLSQNPPAKLSSRSLGGLGGGEVNALSVYNGKIYVGGMTGNGGLLNGVSPTLAYSGLKDAFALAVDADLANQGSDKLAYFGGAGTETAKVQFADGKAWISGQSDAEITGTLKRDTKDAYLARLNIDTGVVEWSQRYSGKSGQVDPQAIAIAKGGSTVLDRLGLPVGTLLYKDTTTLVGNTSVRAGDEFSLRNSRTGATKSLKIEANDTLESLGAKIKRASGFTLETKINKSNGSSSLQIELATKSASIEFLRGPSGKDALESLGLNDGVVRDKSAYVPTDKASDPTKVVKDFGLGFKSDLNLNDKDALRSVQGELDASLSKIKSVYTWLRFGDTTVSSEKKKSSEPVPAYLTKQLSNYQDALNRLTGGG